MTKQILLYCVILTGLTLQGCTNTIDYGTESTEVTKQLDLDAASLQDAATKMVAQMLENAEIEKATQNKRPVLAVFGVIDFTGDNIDLARINSNILNKLNQSNRFRFSSAQDLIQANNRLNPDLYDLVEQSSTANELATTLKADFFLIGEVSKVIRKKPTTKEISYRLTLKALSTANGEFIWQEKQEFLRSEKDIIYGI